MNDLTEKIAAKIIELGLGADVRFLVLSSANFNKRLRLIHDLARDLEFAKPRHFTHTRLHFDNVLIDVLPVNEDYLRGYKPTFIFLEKSFSYSKDFLQTCWACLLGDKNKIIYYEQDEQDFN